MERKRIEKIVALLLVGILIPVSLFPFRINADTITNSNVNINYYLDSVTETSSGSYMQTYRVEFVFDQSYLGWISSRMVGTYITDNNVPITTSQFTKTQAIYVNGTIAETSFTFVTQNSQNGGALQSLSQSIQNSNVTPLADLSTLDDILNVLNDINNNIEIDVIEELQNIVANTELANDYLDTISKLRYYDIPVESFPYIVYCDQKYNSIEYLNQNEFYYTYPLYEINNNVGFYTYLNKSLGEYLDVVYLVSYYDANGNTFAQSHNNVVSLLSNKDLYFCSYTYNGRNVYLYLRFRRYYINSNGYFQLMINSTANALFCPIYAGIEGNMNISTDFALRYELSNKLLDNLQIIANGTTASSSASGSLDQTTSQFSDDANDLVTIEESFNNSMNQNLQSVNPTFNMGSSFLTSANWVSQQFNRIVNNTPFASLITFGLTLGLGLLIIGKVRK